MINNQLSKGKQIALYAVCTAIVALTTFIIRIPALAGGYINFGDTFIFIFACIFGPVAALISGSIGSALADILSGAMVWAPFTFVIKGLEGLVCGLIYMQLTNKTKTVSPIISTIAFVFSAFIMIVGYYFATAIIVGSLKAALAGIFENVIQGGVSIAIALIILHVFKLINLKF